MAEEVYRFDRFELRASDRLLLRDDAPLELGGRYLDALILLVRQEGRLVSKDRFLGEVWDGVPVTDEALTQCVRALRRALGDDAARPRFIATQPRHGYRFIAAVSRVTPVEVATAPQDRRSASLLRLGLAGLAGGAAAGALGGLVYGAVGVVDASGGGGASAVLVLVCLTLIVGLLGGAGVGLGVASAAYGPARTALWRIVGGATGGLLVGALANLVGSDAFGVMFGRAPVGITGGAEGALLGAAIGGGVVLAISRGWSPRRGALAGAGLVGTAAAALTLMGGRLMGGSLDAVATAFPASRLDLTGIGGLFGEADFGPVSEALTAGLEGALFGGVMVAVLVRALRRDQAER